jgi:Flp pilus assembly protein CpaB
MLYHIVMIIILAIFAIAVVVLFRKFTIVRKQRKEWELREMEFLNKLVSEGNLKPGSRISLKKLLK